MDHINYTLYALAAWNLIVFTIYGIDKRKAQKKKWRITERTLILSAFLMGGIGAAAGMSLFRHKTQHTRFKMLIPLAVLFNIIVIIAIYYVLYIR